MITQDDEDAIRSVYLAALTRTPSQRESLYFLMKFKQQPKNRRSKLIEDLFWTLTNSTEFSWNH